MKNESYSPGFQIPLVLKLEILLREMWLRSFFFKHTHMPPKPIPNIHVIDLQLLLFWFCSVVFITFCLCSAIFTDDCLKFKNSDCPFPPKLIGSEILDLWLAVHILSGHLINLSLVELTVFWWALLIIQVWSQWLAQNVLQLMLQASLVSISKPVTTGTKHVFYANQTRRWSPDKKWLQRSGQGGSCLRDWNSPVQA